MTEMPCLLEHIPTSGNRARLTLDLKTRSPHRVNRYLYGKFCEHLGHNIYQGMEAQILLNPTFGRWSFGAAANPYNRPDGGLAIESDEARIARQAQMYHERMGLHKPHLLLRDYADGGAFGWVRVGAVDEVVLSPDVGPHGDRAQRFETLGASPENPKGLATRSYLPLHRTRGYEFRLVGRAAGPVTLTLALSAVEGAPLASAQVSLGTNWQTIEGRLEIPPTTALDPDGLYEFSITTTEDANVVLDRVLVYPDDHVNHADPDVIRMLREAQLPLLRWPGGNFVSGYHWRDGVGPVDARPTLPNPAWQGLEFNLFGTDEFIAFCRAVGCEPMICINAGNGTPEEAAAWVEYCNGSPDTPMGALRAANGHPEPYHVRLWEIGNEVYGRWQVTWTTPGGYVDRYRRFVRAMQAVDPSIRVLACGDPAGGVEVEWNRRLIDEGGELVRSITDHLLTGGLVSHQTDPVELYHGFMGYANTLRAKYEGMCARMRQRGVQDPHVAITELQLFAHYHGHPQPRAALKPETMPTPATISEALYDATIIHECIRMGDLVELLTHSATVNHGGGLRKAHERVWGNPCHYGHAMGIALADGIPVKVTLECDSYRTQMSFGQIPAHEGVPVLDAMAALSQDEQQLVLMLLNRSATNGPVALEIDLGDVSVRPEARVLTLAGESMYDQNTIEEPERIVPRPSVTQVQDGKVGLTIPPFALVRVILELS